MLPGEPLRPGKIYNSNLYVLAGRLQELGFEPEVLGILPDDAEQAAAFIAGWRKKVDLFLTTGGVSVGKKDIMHEVVRRIGTRLFWRVCIKPGAPVIAYTAGDMLGIALSGNPFASYATFELLTRPVLAALAGRSDVAYPRQRASSPTRSRSRATGVASSARTMRRASFRFLRSTTRVRCFPQPAAMP